MSWTNNSFVKRRKSAWELIVLALIVGTVIHLLRTRNQEPIPIPLPEPIFEVPEPASEIKPVDAPKELWCKTFAGVDDVAFSIKTSAAEVQARLPPLLQSTLQCPNHLMIFSDWQETINGQHVIDVLEHVEPKIQATHPDFDLWRRLRKGGPDVLADEEVWEADKTSQKIDKWKMLPMMNRTYHEYGRTKSWFVFTDTHTFLFAHNLHTWLTQLNATVPHYIGISEPSETISPTHHGRTFILSRPALAAVVAEYTASPAAWHDFTSQRASAGVVVRQIVAKARVKHFEKKETSVLLPAWPILQPQSPATIDYRTMYNFKRLWCFPSVSYENLSPDQIQDMFKFESEWVPYNPFKSITHGDVLKDYVTPRLVVRSGRADDWDNGSGEGWGMKKLSDSVTDCQVMCVADESCIQFSWVDGECRFGDSPRMGSWKRGVQSRWLLARVQQWAADREKCDGNEGWFTV